MKLPIISSLSLAVLAGISLVTPAFATVNIDLRHRRQWRKCERHATGTYGAVANAYKIAKNETTISQYAEFLNAVAKTDTYGLYSTGMTTSYINGITPERVVRQLHLFRGSRQRQQADHLCELVRCGAFHQLAAQRPADRCAERRYHGRRSLHAQWGHQRHESPKTSEPRCGFLPKTSGIRRLITIRTRAAPEWAAIGRRRRRAIRLPDNTIGVADSANYYDGDYVGYPGSWLITDVGAYGAEFAKARMGPTTRRATCGNGMMP